MKTLSKASKKHNWMNYENTAFPSDSVGPLPVEHINNSNHHFRTTKNSGKTGEDKESAKQVMGWIYPNPPATVAWFDYRTPRGPLKMVHDPGGDETSDWHPIGGVKGRIKSIGPPGPK